MVASESEPADGQVLKLREMGGEVALRDDLASNVREEPAVIEADLYRLQGGVVLNIPLGMWNLTGSA